MEPNSNEPNNTDSAPMPAANDAYGQLPPQPEVDQLTSLKVDLANDSPQPGSLFTPKNSESSTDSTPTEAAHVVAEQPPVQPQEEVQQAPPEQPVTAQPVMPASEPVVVNHNVAPEPNSNKPSKRKISLKIPMKTAIIALVAVVVLGGGFAAAMIGYIIPNNPNNVLKQAILNSLQASNASVNGSIQIATSGSTTVSYKIYVNGETNRNAKSADLSLNLTVSGVTFPVEVRLVGGNMYFKFGDLSEIASLLGTISPSYVSLAQSLSGQVSNKWFSVDSTLLSEAGVSCYLNADWNFSQSDMQTLQNLYGSYPFMHINSTSSTILNGQSAEEFNVTLNNNKLDSYAKGLNKLSILSQLEKCSKSSSVQQDVPSFGGGNSSSPLTIWVNKSTKQIVQITANAQQGSTKGINGNLSLNFNYKPVSITAPATAEPVLQLLSGLESQLQSSGSGGNSAAQLFSGFAQ